MLWTIFVILLILWLLGLISGYTIGRGRSYPAGHRHRRDTDPSFSGSKTIVALWTLFGEGKVFGMEVVGRFSCRSSRSFIQRPALFFFYLILFH